MSKGNKIEIALLLIIIIGCAVILILNAKGIIKLCGSCKCEPDCLESGESISFRRNIVKSFSDEYPFSLDLESNGKLILNTNNLKDYVIDENIMDADLLEFGGMDVCGLAVLLTLNTDGYLKAYDGNTFYCGEHDISLSDIVEYPSFKDYNKKVLSFYPVTFYVRDDEFEDYGYYMHEVHVTLEDGSTEDITNFFK